MISVTAIGLMVGLCLPLPTSPTLTVQSDRLTVQLSIDGMIRSVRIGQVIKKVVGQTELEGCALAAKVTHRNTAGGGIEFIKTLQRHKDRRTFTLLERFIPVQKNVRWEIEIKDEGTPWNTGIKTILNYPLNPQSRFWTAWADPRQPDQPEPGGQYLQHDYVMDKITRHEWADPLDPQPMKKATLYYGAPYYRYEEPNLFFVPYLRELFCIPLATFLENQDDQGLSLALSPEDMIFDLTMTTTAQGELTFNRLFNRLGQGRTVRFAMDLVAHESDWRAGLGWIVARYPEYFQPAIPQAQDLSGCGAYSSRWIDFDAEKMRAMAFKVNWKASFDFPYMGMFLPPTKDDAEEWTSFLGEQVSVDRMAKYSQDMRRLDFHVLCYFNVFEFGADITWPRPVRKTRNDADLWRNGNDFLYEKLQQAIVLVPENEKPLDSKLYSNHIGEPYVSWRGCILLDPGDPAYRDFLLDQARRHIEKLPASSGICVDRLDWCRFYNHDADDHTSWLNGKPVRSLLLSWKEIGDSLAQIMHRANKVVFVNNHAKRIDMLRNMDGIFDEFTYHGCPLNLTALLSVERPALGWTYSKDNLQPDPDLFFQKYLYMGVFPMAPFPGNDHSLRPDSAVDKYYLDYGPMLNALRGRRWVLQPHVVQTADDRAKVNIFSVDGGYILPVVFARNDTIKIFVKKLPDMSSTARALYPGTNNWQPLALNEIRGKMVIEAPTKRGCAMVRIDKN
jgi:hypothetical protein